MLEETRKLRSHLSLLRKKQSFKGDYGIPHTIKYLKMIIKNLSNIDDKQLYCHYLIIEYLRYGMTNEVELLKWESVEDHLDDPYVWIELAEFYLFYSPNFNFAKAIIDTGICLALSTKKFIIHAHNTKARILRSLNNFSQLQNVLIFLINYEPTVESYDCGFEDDFIKNLPSNSIDIVIINNFISKVHQQR